MRVSLSALMPDCACTPLKSSHGSARPNPHCLPTSLFSGTPAYLLISKRPANKNVRNWTRVQHSMGASNNSLVKGHWLLELQMSESQEL